MDVYLYVYDLSQGMAKMLSVQLTGTLVEGIWHTAVVVYNREVCFGQGIEEFNPQHSKYGHPVEKINMGKTMIPETVFEEYLDHMKTIWTADKYHLLDNNCSFVKLI